MDDKHLYVVIETGGSIGELAERGSYRIVSKVFETKEECALCTKRLSKAYSGGYYDYHYQTKTLEWAKKYCLKSEIERLENDI